MKTIEINKGGFGIASLFSKTSSKHKLYEAQGMNGDYLEELGIESKAGDCIKICTPLRSGNGHSISFCRVYNVTDTIYEAEFISSDIYSSETGLSKFN